MLAGGSTLTYCNPAPKVRFHIRVASIIPTPSFWSRAWGTTRAAGMLLLMASFGAAAQEPALAIQQRIKAAFLYKFAAFVEWPAQAFSAPESPIGLCLAGAEGIARELEQAVAGRQVTGRPVLVRRVKRGDPLGPCHILFLSAHNDAEANRELLDAALDLSVLTVTEAERSHPPGAVINFLAVDDRIRFDISREAADRKQLQVRSQLLAVARQVISP